MPEWITYLLIPAFAALATVVNALYKRLESVQATAMLAQKEHSSALEEELACLRKRLEEIRARLSAVEAEKNKLQTQLLMMSSAQDTSPLPLWIKDASGVCLMCNPAYERTFLLPRGYVSHDYVGHTDNDIWPERIARAFRDNDQKVMKTRELIDTTEMVPDGNGKDKPWRIIKFPRYAPGVEEPFGIAGIAIPDSEFVENRSQKTP